MTTNLTDTFTIDGVKRTADGYLAAFARVARTGIQEYKGREVGRPDMETVRVYRPESEVFSEDAMKSFAHRPITLTHPSVPVTKKNWKKFAGGQTGDAIVRDGEFIRVPMLMMDEGLIDAYERRGIKELSMGYSTELKWTPGLTTDGQPYDAMQTEIRANHLALVPVARGGKDLRIGDAVNPDPFDEDEDEEEYALTGDAWSDEARKASAEARKSGNRHSQLANKHLMRNADAIKSERDQHKIAGGHHAAAAHLFERAEKAFNGGKMHQGEQYSKMGQSMGNKADRMSTRLGIHDSAMVDSIEENNNDSKGDYTMKLVIDGLTANVADDQSGAIIEKHIASLEKQLASVNDAFADFKKKKAADDESMEDSKKACDAKDGEIAVLKKQIADAVITPQVLDQMVKNRLAVSDAAKPFLGKDYAFDAKSVEEMRRDAVVAHLGDAAKDMSDEVVGGAFIAMTKDAKPVTAATQIADSIKNRPHSVVRVNDAAETAHAEMVKRQSEAWKTPVQH